MHRPKPTTPTPHEPPAHRPYAHPAALPLDDLLKQCTFEQGRSKGPGGQHRNKVETLVEVTHEPSGVMAHAGERREMSVNRKVAITRLRLALAMNVRTPVPLGEIGSELWKSRLQTKRGPDGKTSTRVVVNEHHEDYPALLAEAMDVIASANYDLAKAALRLQTSSSQLVKLLDKHKPALAEVNEQRKSRGMHALK
jgi:hypothetical protein